VNKAAIGVIVAVGIGVLVLSVIISNDSPENMELESDEITLDESAVFEEEVLPEEQVNVGKEISVELFEKVGMSSP